MGKGAWKGVADLTVATDTGSEAREMLSSEPAAEQVMVGDIPRVPPGFRPRTDLLDQLDRDDAGVSVIYSAAGLQGLGATQLAAAYARAKLADGWRLVAWVNGSDTGSLRAGLAAVADATGLIDTDSGREIADAAQAVRYWLEADGGRCLLVVDDVTDPEELRPFIPVGGAARVLVTCARQPAPALGHSVPIDVFSAAEAAEFLDRTTGLADAEGAAAVAAELGQLPLALAHAATVIAGQRLTYWGYLDRLQTRPPQEDPAQDQTELHQHGAARGAARGAAGAVLLSLQAVRASDRTGVCHRVMEIMAVLSPAGVRRDLLHVAGRVGVLVSGRRVPPATVDRALEWLSARSLLTFSLDGQTVIMHRLVAQAVRDTLARRQRLTAARLAATFVLDTYARALAGSQDRPAVRAIPQHVTALLALAEPAVEADDDLARVLLRLRFIALYHLIELRDSATQAIAVGEPLSADLERLLGAEHPDTLNARNSLAAAYLAVGRTDEAITLFEQILAARQSLLGSDDPATLNAQNNLAAAYQDAGRATDAIPLYEANLAVRERLLGAEHPSTLNSQGNLAAAYRDAGRATEAISLFEQTLADRERVLGPDHPDTRISRQNLAAAYQDAGRAEESARLAGQTSTSRKLAAAYRDGARTAEAIPPVEQALTAQASQSAVDAAEEVLATFRRPPADSARRTLPASFRRPPADPARQSFPKSFTLPAAKPGAHAAHAARPAPAEAGRSQQPSPEAIRRDREIVAAIAAADPAGMAMAYDRYARGLYGYCHWLLREPADAAAAVQDTFIIAATASSSLPDAAKLRPWLYAIARRECRRRPLAVPASRDQRASTANQPSAPASALAAAQAPGPADATVPVTPLKPQYAPPPGPADATVPVTPLKPQYAPPPGPADATMPVTPLKPSFEPAPGPADATMPVTPLRPLSELASDLGDATITFRAIKPSEPPEPVPGPADATVQFAAIKPAPEPAADPADATVRFRAIKPRREPAADPADATVTFRAIKPRREPAADPADATVTFRAIRPPTQTLDGTVPFPAIRPTADPASSLPRADGEMGQAELRALIRSILADLKPREREALELSFRHDLHDHDLAVALGVSWKRAHTRVSRATTRLDKDIAALRIARTKRHACSVLAELLADWDGQLTEEVRELVIWHMEECPTCSSHRQGALRPAAISHLLPLAPLPPDLREQVLSRCTSPEAAAVAYRRRLARRAEPTWFAEFGQAVRQVNWDSIRGNPGAAIAAVAIALWLAAAVSVPLLTLAADHTAQAQAVQPRVRASSSLPAPAPTTAPPSPAAIRTSPATRHSASASTAPAYVPPVQPLYSPTVSPSPSLSASTSQSASSSASASASPKPSSSPKPSPSSSPSPTV
jgi:RNA polymerase sigma factor (sigma-70 family)